MKYIKLFSTSAEYEAFISGDQFVTPNISFIPTERLAKYSSMPKPKAEPKVTLEYDCPEDNLLAFTSGVGNVKKLTVDSKNIEFEPLQNIQGTKEIFASEIVIDKGSETAQLPNDYIFPQLPSFIKIKPMDPSYEITNNTYFFMFAHIPMYNMTMAAGGFSINEGVKMGYFILNDDNSVSLGEVFMTEMKPMFDMYGYQPAFCLCENAYSDNPTFINTSIEFEGVVGGLQTPYYFGTPGHHTVEMELTDGNFGEFYMFLNAVEEQWAALTSVTLNESITYIYPGTFVSRSLTHITCEGEIAPILGTMDEETGINVPYFGTLVYPKRSDYSSWLDVKNGFGMYGWNQEPPVITCTYNVTDISTPTKICNELSDYNGNFFSNITVDGVLMTNQSTGVTFTTIQNHTVKFELNKLSIPDSAFNGCSGLTEVTIGSGVTSIGRSAFEGCSGLTSINIPDSVTSIGTYAFRYCSGLTSIIIPDSVTTIGDSAFYGCSGLPTENNLVYADKWVVNVTDTNLSSYIIKDSTTGIGAYAFQYCYKVTSIVIPDSVKIIDSFAFSGCKGLTGELIIPDSVKTIGHYAFAECKGLTGELVIPDSVTTIDYEAFKNCSGLTEVTIGSGVTEIGNNIFKGCSSLSSIVVSSDNPKYDSRENCNCIIETASNTLLQGCNNSFIPYGVTTIDNEAFYSCTGLTSIVIPDSVKTIESSAFKNCSGLTGELVIPDSVTEISTYVFDGCSSLSSIVVSSGNPKYDSRENCNCIIETASNTLLQGCNNSFIPYGVTSIYDHAFRNCTGLTSINIPDSVTTIDNAAFRYCTSLTEVTIGSGVTEIDKSAFHDCSSLSSIVVSPGNSVYDSRENCNCIIETATNTLLQGSNNSFIPNGVTTIDNEAFANCTGLTSIIIPDSVTSIGNYAFRYCTSLTEVTIGSGVTEFKNSTFDGCSSLSSIVVSSDNPKYDSRENCNCIIETATNILIKGFNNTVIPDSVTSIGNYAFSGCTSLTELTIGSGVTNIGMYAFYDCSSISSITCLASTAPSINTYTFYNITSNGTLYVPAGSNYSSWMSELRKYGWTIQEITTPTE